ncbi:MAG: DEAD/DEAH box helicase [Myxococcota bacterium]|nr:DEAD/DEAH box helicase [Myxococcota bacterium]
MSFSVFGLHPGIVAAVERQGYTVPTPIQTAAIPLISSGRDLLGCAATGTGKTAAFALPIINRLVQDPKRRRLPRALVLVPTRELALQIAESFDAYSNGNVRCAVLIGGVGANHQVASLRNGCEVIVAAPGRMLDLMEQGAVDLRVIGVLVLDEADRMLDMGFIRPLKRIIAALPRERQSLLFSATMPEDIRKLASGLLRDPANIAVNRVAEPAKTVDQRVYHVPQHDKSQLLKSLFSSENMTRAIVFTRTKHGANRLGRRLEQAGIANGVIHGNKSQNARVQALDAFRRGCVPMLIATDVAARGIDVDGISHVVNFDLPNEPESYVHRIGRTGRAGAAGSAIAFCDPSERDFLRQIEHLTRAPLKVVGERPPETVAPGRKRSAGRR